MIISREARARIQEHGRKVCAIRQDGVPFDVPLWLPIVNPFARKQMRFHAQYRLAGVTLEEAREAILFADYSPFMDMKRETFSRKNRTRHFKMNPFTKKLGEVLGGPFGPLGTYTGKAVANALVSMLGLVEWEMSEEPPKSPDLVTIHVKVSSWFWGGRFVLRLHREADGVIVDDDWMPEQGEGVRTAWFPMAALVLSTHPLGFEQITEEAVEEVLRARSAGRPCVGEIGPPAEEID